MSLFEHRTENRFALFGPMLWSTIRRNESDHGTTVFPREVIPLYRAAPNNDGKQKRLFQELLD